MKNSSARNRIIIIFRKLGLYSFFGMFVYFLLSKAVGEQYGLSSLHTVWFLLLAIVSFGLMMTPPEFKLKYLLSWLQLYLYLSIPILFGVGFYRQDYLHVPKDDSILIACMLIATCNVLLITFFIVYNTLKDNQPYLTSKEIKDNFVKAAARLGLATTDKTDSRIIRLNASGKTELGDLTIGIYTRNFNPQKNFGRISSYSGSQIEILLRQTTNEFSIIVQNEALSSIGLSTGIEDKINDYIKNKNLSYFNFQINSNGKDIVVSVDSAIEEFSAWVDFVTLIEIVVSPIR